MSRLSKGFGSILNDRPHNAFVKDDISYKHKSDGGEGLGDLGNAGEKTKLFS